MMLVATPLIPSDMATAVIETVRASCGRVSATGLRGKRVAATLLARCLTITISDAHCSLFSMSSCAGGGS